MVLPLYATLQKIDQSLLEAAADLGCPRWKAFWTVTLPLSLPGVAAGVLLCFIPIVGEFVIPDLLGGSDTMMIGQTLWTEFFSNKDWPIASAIAIVLLCLLVVPIAVFENLRTRGPRGAIAMRRGLSLFNLTSLALGLAFLYLPIAILVIYSFNESRLVAVWGGWSIRWYAELLEDRAMIEAARMSLLIAVVVRGGGDRARHLGGAGACPVWTFSRPDDVFGDDLCAARHARGHYRPVAAAVVRRGRRRPRLLDSHDRAHDADDVLRHGHRAIAASGTADRSLEEAAMDLGCPPLRTFSR